MSCSALNAPTDGTAPLSQPAPTVGSAARTVKIAGHRGAGNLAPENTLASFQLAVDLQVDMIELDVHLSKDDQLVVMHDPHVERTTDGKGDIHSFTLAELRTLNAAAKFSGDTQYPPQQVPTLQEVYSLVQGRCPINIEIKETADGGRYAGIEEKVVDLVQRNNAGSYSVISSFNFPTLDRVRELAPELERYAIISTAYFKAMGLRGGGPEAVAKDMSAHGYQWVAVDKRYLTPEIAAALTDAGITLHAWVVNDLPTLARFEAIGVQYVTSDQPDVLLNGRTR